MSNSGHCRASACLGPKNGRHSGWCSCPCACCTQSVAIRKAQARRSIAINGKRWAAVKASAGRHVQWVDIVHVRSARAQAFTLCGKKIPAQAKTIERLMPGLLCLQCSAHPSIAAA